LLSAIKGNERIRELAINPLMLTVIAMVHRDRVKLPDRRAELYAEAVDVLLGKWEEAKGLHEIAILDDKPFDTGDRRLMLASLALHLHEQQLKEISVGDLRAWLQLRFDEILHDAHAAERAADRFLQVIEERTGMLSARGEGVFAFSHLTFQEYLAALAVAAKDNYVGYSLQRAPDEWWREVILLEAGYLSTLSKEKVTRLIRAIIDLKDEPKPYHNLVLAAYCVRDVGSNRVQDDFENEIQGNLHKELDSPPPHGFFGTARVYLQTGMSTQGLAQRRIAAAEALARIGGKSYWSLPYGEPEWVTIPAGEFWMGEDEEAHQVYLDRFAIARVPVSVTQYELFLQATNHRRPPDWEEDLVPVKRGNHPVYNVSWDDAMAYCQWLSQMTGKSITLPSEAEWEKAARGDRDKRTYPWGDIFEATRCNSDELGLNDTTPVGIFLNGASPYGVLDLSGNVWEWTRSMYGPYPYEAKDGRENLEGREARVLRGGAFGIEGRAVRCACRDYFIPDLRFWYFGFRLVVSPF
jgi:formylglycine-generating enzyme required for sulfatase activity